MHASLWLPSFKLWHFNIYRIQLFMREDTIASLYLLKGIGVYTSRTQPHPNTSIWISLKENTWVNQQWLQAGYWQQGKPGHLTTNTVAPCFWDFRVMTHTSLLFLCPALLL